MNLSRKKPKTSIVSKNRRCNFFLQKWYIFCRHKKNIQLSAFTRWRATCFYFVEFLQKNIPLLKKITQNWWIWEGIRVDEKGVYKGLLCHMSSKNKQKNCRNWSIYIYILVIVKEKVTFDKKKKQFWISTTTGTGSCTKAPMSLFSHCLLGH